jgi:hypothetical protein
MANAIAAGASDLAMVDIMKIGGVTGWMAAMDGRLIDVQAAFVRHEGEEAQPHASTSANSRKIACIQAGASLRSCRSSRRLMDS